MIGYELCDDGNKNDNIGCLANCTGFISGWQCSGGTNLTPDICTEICGDGLVLGTEICDDGADNDGKGCANGCRGVNPLYICSSGSPTSLSVC